MNIIALVGFKGSGKDTVANVLVEHGYHRISFADSLKDVLSAMFGWDRAMLEGDTLESREWREQVDEWWADHLEMPNFTPRWAMQNIGTNILRQYLHPNLWVFNVERKIAMLPPDSNIVLVDARFPNELDIARNSGGKIVRIRRGPEPSWLPMAVKASNGGAKAVRWMRTNTDVHESEWSWLGAKFDTVIENDATLDVLKERAKQCL